MKSLSRVWLFAIPWIVVYQASLSMGFSRQGYWNGLPFLSSGDLPDPGIEPRSPALQARHFTLWATREALSTLWATREALSTFSIILNVSPLGGLSWPLQSLSTEPDSFKETIDSDCICLCAFHGQLESLRLCQDDIWHRLPSIPGACVCGHISFLTFWLLDYKFLLAHAWKAGQTSGQALDDLAHGKSHELRFRSPSPCAQNLCSGDSPRGAPAF